MMECDAWGAAQELRLEIQNGDGGSVTERRCDGMRTRMHANGARKRDITCGHGMLPGGAVMGRAHACRRRQERDMRM